MDKINRFLGSPPHTWRILPVVDFEADDGGITSTYVENTTVVSLVVNTSKDHLHIRGEYHDFMDKINRFLGSPPHTWRILPVVDFEADDGGITSTYVENTTVVSLVVNTSKDHLHIRGEYLIHL